MSRLPNPEINLDPVLAAIVGAAIVVGGGAAAYGATRDTTPDPAPAPVAQKDDAVVARALAIVQKADGTTPTAASAAETARQERAAREAASKGRSVDPFPEAKNPAGTGSTAGAATTASGTTPAASGSSPATASVPSAAELAKGAVATAAATNAAIQAATGGSTSGTAATGGGSSTDSRAVAIRLLASKPAKVTLRIATQKRRTTVSKRSLGLLVPNATSPVARVVKVNATNRVVTLRLSSGAFLTGPQSKGTMCIKRATTGDKDCRLIRVRTGRTAVIRAHDTAKGRRGAVTAIRVLAVWRGGYKLAE